MQSSVIRPVKDRYNFSTLGEKNAMDFNPSSSSSKKYLRKKTTESLLTGAIKQLNFGFADPGKQLYNTIRKFSVFGLLRKKIRPGLCVLKGVIQTGIVLGITSSRGRECVPVTGRKPG